MQNLQEELESEEASQDAQPEDEPTEQQWERSRPTSSKETKQLKELKVSKESLMIDKRCPLRIRNLNLGKFVRLFFSGTG